MYRQCLLLITLGGEQREKCKISRKRRGEVQSFPAINYSVHRGRTAVAQRSHEKKQRSHYQLPHHPHFHPQAAASAAAKENHDGRGKRGVLQDNNCSGSAVRPGRCPGPQRAQPCARVLHPPGSLPERAPRPGWGSATYLLQSMAEAKVAGSPKSRAAPGDHLPSTPQVPPPPLPSAAATHSHHGRHRSTRVLTHFIVETTPARVE